MSGFSSSRRHSATHGGVRHRTGWRFFRLPVRQTQGIGRTFQLHVQVMTVVSLNDLFKRSAAPCEFIEVGHLAQRIWHTPHPALQRVNHLATASSTDSTVRSVWAELRLLRQIANFQVLVVADGFRPSMSVSMPAIRNRVDFTGTVKTENADLRAREEAQEIFFKI